MTQPILVLDFETTGLKPDWHDPIQVAAVLLRGEDLVEIAAFAALMKPSRPDNADPGALEIHGYTLDDLSNAISPASVFAVLAHMVGLAGRPVIVAGHNVGFDLEFLKAAERDFGFTLPRPDHAPFCTCITSRIHLEAHGLTPDAKLGTIAAHYGIDFQAHDALGDVRATAEIIRRLRDESPRLYSRGLSGELLDGLLDDAGPAPFAISCRQQYKAKGYLSPNQIRGLVRVGAIAST